MGNKFHCRERNNPNHQLRPLNDRSIIKEVRCIDYQEVCLG
ncbi:hypothetical protein LINGRAHAP2_LOCUS3487 [Linum grandiflorum]